MAATGAFAVLVALSTATALATPAGQRAEPAFRMPHLAIHAPDTVPAAPSPRLKHSDLARELPVDDVDVTGPAN